MSSKFIKKTEDFTCENCGQKVVGTGYTNHCPNCLWSKHVDINPGDREADCGGMMEPEALELKEGIFRIRHKCTICGHEKLNKAEKGDNFQKLVDLSSKHNK